MLGRTVVFGLAVLVAFSGCDDSAIKEVSLAPPSGWKTLYNSWKYPQPVPAFPLVDQDGRAFNLSRYDGSYLLVGFVFSRCGMPKACPLTMKNLKAVQDAVEASSAPLNLQLLSLTLDPDFDKPPVLAAWAIRVGAHAALWTLATGDKELLTKALPSMFNVLALPGPEATLQHSVKVALLGPNRKLVKEWKDNAFDVGDVLSAMKRPQQKP